MTPPADLEIPEHTLLRRIGGGSYGEVWLARSATEAWRAVKVVRRDSFKDDDPYQQELVGIQKFEPVSRQHPGVIDVLQVGFNAEAGYFYHVMELADDAGGHDKIDPEIYQPRTLQSELEQRGRLPVPECLEAGRALADALAHLHGHGLVHRDLKPANVVYVQGQPKLADIGLVAATDDAGSLVGTHGYIPDEGTGSPQADLYGLGKVIYEMATGKDRQDFPELPGPEPELRELNLVILKACAEEPAERYPTAAALAGCPNCKSPI